MSLGLERWHKRIRGLPLETRTESAAITKPCELTEDAIYVNKVQIKPEMRLMSILPPGQHGIPAGVYAMTNVSQDIFFESAEIRKIFDQGIGAMLKSNSVSFQIGGVPMIDINNVFATDPLYKDENGDVIMRVHSMNPSEIEDLLREDQGQSTVYMFRRYGTDLS